MAIWLGIDVGSTSAKVAVVRSAYRKLTIERLAFADVAEGDVTRAVRDAVTKALEGMPPGVDAIATAIEGNKAAIHRLVVPATAQRQLAEVLAYELEAQVPFDMEGAVFDWRVLERAGQATGSEGQVAVVAAVARTDDVRARIHLVREAVSQDPERVAVGAFALAALAPHVSALAEHETFAIVDLGAKASEVLVVEKGDPVFARTLSTGTEGLPGTASRLARDIRVSIAAHRAQGGAAPIAVYVCGGGAFVSGAEGFLSGELETPVYLLPAPNLELGAIGEASGELPRYAKAVALALTLAGRGTGLNLRRGPLAFERGFSWVRDKIPVLAGFGAVIVLSFVFATWAHLYALHKERAALEEALGTVTRTVLGTEITTAEEAQDLLSKQIALTEDDPMPHADAFDVMVRLSEVIPPDMTHDIDELDVQKGHVIVRGIVKSIPDAQQVASSLGDKVCFTGVSIKSTTQAVGSDRQKYAMELDLKCPEDVRAPARKKDDASSAAGGK